MNELEADTALINDLAKYAGMPPSRMATTIGVAFTTLTRPANGKATTRVGRSTIEKLRQQWPDYPGWSDKLQSDAGADRPVGLHEAPDRPLIITTSSGDGAVEIRQLDLSYSMGPGASPEDFPEETPVLFDANFLRSISRAPTHRLYVARGEGDSMFPTLINDDQVLVDTTQNQLSQQDRIWALSYDGAHMIKRLRRAGKGRIKIISDNSTVPIDEVDESDLRIFGRVIWVGRRV